MTQPIHVERGSLNDWEDDESYVYTMWCGAQCIIGPDANIISPDRFDFYTEQYWQKATCQECKRSFIKPGVARKPEKVGA